MTNAERLVVRTITRIVLSLSLTAGALAATQAPAQAALSPIPDKTWMTNGNVYSEVEWDNVVYIGGEFTRVSKCPPESSCPKQTVQVKDVAAFDASTGAALPSFSPRIQGTGAIVYALAVLGGRLFIGGQFAAVNRVSHRNFAVLDLPSGTLDPDANAQVGVDNSDRIRGMVATSTRVYIAGAFTSIDGLTRNHLAAFGPKGKLDPTWTPSTGGGGTDTLTMSCDGSMVIAGGGFQRAGGSRLRST